MDINKQLIKTLQGFESITLDDMNKRAKLMERQERKMLTTELGLVNILKEFQKDYYLLEEKGARMSPYDNTYMDTKHLIFYHDHENGKDLRIKVRKRKYVNSNKTFIEYKLKDNVNAKMEKKRMELGKNSVNHMDAISRSFFKKEHGGNLFVMPKMKTDYKRITLCNKKTEERVTIDLNLVFSEPKQPNGVSFKVNNLVIFEVKQAVGATDTFCKDIIEKHGGIESEGCSKYCLGLIYFEKVKKFNHFKKTLAFIEANGGVTKSFRKKKKAKPQTKKK